MFEDAKWYIAKVVIPRYLPVAVISGIGYVVTFMLAHAKVLEPYGITTGQWPLKMDPPSGMCTLIEWATLGTKTGLALSTLVPVLIVAIQHHTTGNGTAVAGGRRETDPPSKGDSNVINSNTI